MKPIDQSESVSASIQPEPEALVVKPSATTESTEEQSTAAPKTTNPKHVRHVDFVTDDEEKGDSWFAADDLDDRAHFSGFLRNLDRWAKLTLVAVEQGEMQPVVYKQL